MMGILLSMYLAAMAPHPASGGGNSHVLPSSGGGNSHVLKQ